MITHALRKIEADLWRMSEHATPAELPDAASLEELKFSLMIAARQVGAQIEMLEAGLAV